MSYRVWIANDAKAEIRDLPGNVRQRIRLTVQDLNREPRPHTSRVMRPPVTTEMEVRRLRLDHWRVVDVIDDTSEEIGVLAVRKRPPYDYSDLPDLLAELQE